VSKFSYTRLDQALAEASIQCHASADKKAVVYYTTDDTFADPESGELYLVFRGDQVARHHLNEAQGWKACYTVAAGEL
jgi:hypothetical protein